jgi:Fungal specific transcription factor domain
MCRDSISRAHSALVGAAIRLAECMGLHRDPSEYNYSPVDTHVRRLIWYQLCFLDIRTAEVQGPRPSIRGDEFTTKFPLNLNDEDIMAGSKEGSKEWTDMTFSRIRFESQEIIRDVLIDRIRLEQKKITITGALAKIESFRKAMYERHGPIFNRIDMTPLQHAASVTLSFMIHRLHIMLLHKFYNTWPAGMPDRILQLIVNTGAQQLEDAVTLETSPDLRPWQWYSRAYHNFHAALLLLAEVSNHPLRREADRIWRSLEYVFEVEDSYQHQNLSRSQIIEHRRRNAHHILSQFRDRMKVYQSLRRIKYSANIDDIRIGRTEPRSFVSTDAVSKETEPTAIFNLNPMTLLPGVSAIEQARTRQTQPPLGYFQNQGNILNAPTTTDSQNNLPGNLGDGVSQFGARAPVREATHGIPGTKSTWATSPSNMFAQTPPMNLPSGISPPSSEDMPMPEIDWVSSFYFLIIYIHEPNKCNCGLTNLCSSLNGTKSSRLT